MKKTRAAGKRPAHTDFLDTGWLTTVTAKNGDGRQETVSSLQWPAWIAIGWKTSATAVCTPPVA